jgi:riboflavin kinase/FMN adenylyltransferase
VVKGPLCAVGNFDGVHRGHRELLAQTVAFAREKGARPGAVVFEPHPRRFFQPDAPAFLLTTPEKRERLLREAGAQTVPTLTFDAALASTTPRDFVVDVLKRRLGLSGAVVGSEFRFGKGRAGGAAEFERFCREAGLAVLIVEPQREADGDKVSSSAVRVAIARGDMREAARLLGRNWSVDGVVLEGRRLGRTLGFPTANLSLGELVEPRRGVYAVRTRVDASAYDGVANFGRRPTLGEEPPLLEAFLFDFEGDLYGRRLEVEFLDFIRAETKFESVDALKAQIETDCAEARRLLRG